MRFGKSPQWVLTKVVIASMLIISHSACLTYSSSSADNSAALSFSAGNSSLTVSSNIVATNDKIKITLILKDGNGNSIYKSGYNIQFQMKGDQLGTFSQVIDKYNGTFETTFTAGDKPGTTVLNAVVDNVLINAGLPRIQVVIDPSSLIVDTKTSSISATPATVIADGYTPSYITVTLKNSVGVPIPAKSVYLSSSRSQDIIDANNPVATNSNGQSVFVIHSSSVGISTLTAVADSVVLPISSTVLFLTTTPIADYQARAYNSAQAGYNFALDKNVWKDLSSSSKANDGSLHNFLFNSLSGWGGSGTTANPYALIFNSKAGNYATFGMNLNHFDDFTFETWFTPLSSTTAGSVILSNGNATNNGMALRQASDGSGKLQLLLGNRSYADEVLADQPTGYWRLDDPINNFLASDISGNSKLAVYSGSPTQRIDGMLTNDTVNYSVGFDGSSSFLHLSDYLTGPTTTTYSYELWFKTNTSNGTGGVLIGTTSADYPASGSAQAHWLPILYVDNNGYLRGKIWTVLGGTLGATTMKSTNKVNDAKWHHAVLVAADTLELLYLDGAQIGVIQEPIAYSEAYKTLIGLGYTSNWPQTNNGWMFFNGQIDEVAFYSSALSEQRVVDHYNGRTHASCLSGFAMSDRTKYMVSGVFDSSASKLRLYVNGTPECTLQIDNSLSLSAPSVYKGSTYPFTVGAGLDETFSPIIGTVWTGAFSELRVYNQPLSDSAISKHFTTTYNLYY